MPSFPMRRVAEHSLFRNAFALVWMQLTNYLVPLLLLPFLTRVLGVSAFGHVAITLGLVQMAFVVTDYGFSLSATYEIASNKTDHSFINKKIGSIFGAKAILLAGTCVVLLSAPYFVPSYASYSSFFRFSLLAIAAQAFQPTWLFQGLERMKRVAIYNVAAKMLYCVAVLCLVRSSADALTVIICWGVAQFIGLVTALYFVRVEGYRVAVPTWAQIKEEFRNGAHFFWSRIAVAVYTSASAVIIGAHSAGAAAHFAVCEQMYKAGQNATAPVNGALFPYMAKTKDWSMFYRLLVVFGICIAVIAVGVAFFATDLLTVIFGREYASAAPVLSVFLLALVVNYFAVAFGYPAFSALGTIRPANTSVMVGAVLHCAMLVALYFSCAISAFTVVSAILVTETTVLIFRVIAFSSLRRGRNLQEIYVGS